MELVTLEFIGSQRGALYRKANGNTYAFANNATNKRVTLPRADADVLLARYRDLRIAARPEPEPEPPRKRGRKTDADSDGSADV